MMKKESAHILPVLLLPLVLALCLLSACGGETPEEPVVLTDEEVLSILDSHDFAFYIECGEEDWYGITTDDERIAMADDLLDMMEELGFSTGDNTGNTVAQSMNDYYDQDKSKSIYDVFCTVLSVEDGPSYEELYRANHDASAGGTDLLWGDWYNDEADVSLLFCSDGTFAYSDGSDDIYGTYSFDGEEIVLESEEGVTETGWMDEDGDLIFENLDGWFYYVD